jgi:hypothetical protein
VTKEISELSDKNLEALVHLGKFFQKMDFGWTNCSFRVHDGKVTEIINQEFQERKFKQDQNVEAVSWVGNQIKEKHEKEWSGSVTFTFVFNEGNIKKITAQEGKRCSFH